MAKVWDISMGWNLKQIHNPDPDQGTLAGVSLSYIPMDIQTSETISESESESEWFIQPL